MILYQIYDLVVRELWTPTSRYGSGNKDTEAELIATQGRRSTCYCWTGTRNHYKYNPLIWKMIDNGYFRAFKVNYRDNQIFSAPLRYRTPACYKEKLKVGLMKCYDSSTSNKHVPYVTVVENEGKKIVNICYKYSYDYKKYWNDPKPTKRFGMIFSQYVEQKDGRYQLLHQTIIDEEDYRTEEFRDTTAGF